MSRLALLFLIIASSVGVMTFSVKQKVAALESSLLKTCKKINEYEESTHLLLAEWNFLNNPARIQQLAETHLHFIPGSTIHVVKASKQNNNHGNREKMVVADSSSEDAVLSLINQLED